MNIDERRALRLRVMRAIFDAAKGSEYNFVSGWQLRDELGIGDQDLADACKYLEGEYLLKIQHTLGGQMTPAHIQLTHHGIKEIEQSLEDPESSTEHFPPLVSIQQHFHGDVIGSSIATGSTHVNQTTGTGDIDLGSLRDFTAEYDKVEDRLGLELDADQEVRAEIQTIKAQLQSPRPKPTVLRESVRSIRTALEGAAGNVAASELLLHMAHIHF